MMEEVDEKDENWRPEGWRIIPPNPPKDITWSLIPIFEF